MTSPKIPYRQQPTLGDMEFNLGEEQKTPIWADILYGGVKNRHKLKDTFKEWEKDPNLIEPAIQGLLGQHLLNQFLPKNMKANLKDKSIDYSPTDNLDIGFNKQGDTNFLNLGWRF
jgi:hypothetical protein